MATTTPKRPMTAEEVMALPDDGKRYELTRGELICMSPFAWWPGVVAANILGELWNFVKPNRLGVCGTADSGFVLSKDPDTLRAPDVWFVRAERITADAPSRTTYWPGYPDLAVEVLSPSDRYSDVRKKVREYLAAGTRLVWVIDPEDRTAEVYRPDGPVLFLDENGTLEGGDVLPGFTLILRAVLA